MRSCRNIRNNGPVCPLWSIRRNHQLMTKLVWCSYCKRKHRCAAVLMHSQGWHISKLNGKLVMHCKSDALMHCKSDALMHCKSDAVMHCKSDALMHCKSDVLMHCKSAKSSTLKWDSFESWLRKLLGRPWSPCRPFLWFSTNRMIRKVTSLSVWWAHTQYTQSVNLWYWEMWEIPAFEIHTN